MVRHSQVTPKVSLAETKRKRVAIYGGTFDPPTNSHMSLGREVGLDFAEFFREKHGDM